MLTISFTYKGKSYTDFEDAITTALHDGIVKSVREKLEPFENEIIKQSGKVEVEISDDLSSASIKVENVSPELAENINAYLKRGEGGS